MDRTHPGKPSAAAARAYRQRAGGFTLIEMLVTISIIGLLIGLLMPVTARVKNMAEKVTCSSSLRQMGLVIEMYSQDHKDTYPKARYMPEPFISSSPDPAIMEPLDFYIDKDSNEASIYQCPDDRQVYALAGISYEYQFTLGGRTLDEVLGRGMMRRMNIDTTRLTVMRDFDNAEFFLSDGTTIDVPMRHIGRNILFADGHVGKLEF